MKNAKSVKKCGTIPKRGELFHRELSWKEAEANQNTRIISNGRADKLLLRIEFRQCGEGRRSFSWCGMLCRKRFQHFIYEKEFLAMLSKFFRRSRWNWRLRIRTKDCWRAKYERKFDSTQEESRWGRESKFLHGKSKTTFAWCTFGRKVLLMAYWSADLGSGCKLVCLALQDNSLHYEAIFPHEPQRRSAEGWKWL